MVFAVAIQRIELANAVTDEPMEGLIQMIDEGFACSGGVRRGEVVYNLLVHSLEELALVIASQPPPNSLVHLSVQTQRSKIFCRFFVVLIGVVVVVVISASVLCGG